MIYFMQAVDGGAVKIGHSVNVGRRHGELEQHYGRTLAILAVIPGNLETEREMHARFAHLQLPSKSGIGRKPELFRPGPDLMGFIGGHLLVDQNPDVVEVLMAGRDMKPFAFNLTVDEHKQLRVEAAKEGMSMAMFARKLVSDFLAKARSKGKGKEKT